MKSPESFSRNYFCDYSYSGSALRIKSFLQKFSPEINDHNETCTGSGFQRWLYLK